MTAKTRLIVFVVLLVATDVAFPASPARRMRCRKFARSSPGRLSVAVDPVVGKSVTDNGRATEETVPSSQLLFDGKTLAGWTTIEEYDFERHGEISVRDGSIILSAGKPATGIRVNEDFPRMNYELTLDTKRIEGSDFFCGITFPVGDDYLSLVLGGWGGGTTGISNLDNMSAIENATTDYHEFEQDRWYRVRLRVTDEKVETWIDNKQIVDVEHTKHKLSIWWEQEPVRPFGIASWYTTSALRNIQLKRL